MLAQILEPDLPDNTIVRSLPSQNFAQRKRTFGQMPYHILLKSVLKPHNEVAYCRHQERVIFLSTSL
jgi:hypothetical protein